MYPFLFVYFDVWLFIIIDLHISHTVNIIQISVALRHLRPGVGEVTREQQDIPRLYPQCKSHEHHRVKS